jgi:hypothetical protein
MTVHSKAQVCKCEHAQHEHNPNADKCLVEECNCKNFNHRPKMQRIKKNEKNIKG